MPKFAERGAAHLLIPLILLAGIIGGVYLVSTGNLKLFSRAANPPIVFKNFAGQAITTTTSPSVKIELTSTLGAPVFATPSSIPVGIGTTAPTQISGTVSYRLAENPTDLDKASFTPYTQHPTVLDYTFKDTAPGAKFIWADFKDVTGITDRKTAQIELISPTSSPTPFACTACNSDVKKDGYVNGGDVSYLIGCYNKLSTDKDRNGKSCADRDIYPDGVINGREFSCIRTVFNQKCTSSPTPTPTPQAAKRIFVTYQSYSGNLGGLSGADAICQSKGSRYGSRIWKAWLSSTTVAARDRLSHSSGPYILPNASGTVVADNWDSLVSGRLKSPINITDGGGQAASNWVIFTNTNSNGSITAKNPWGDANDACKDWTMLSQYGFAGAGNDSVTDGRWTSNGSTNCSNGHLYCFEQ